LYNLLGWAWHGLSCVDRGLDTHYLTTGCSNQPIPSSKMAKVQSYKTRLKRQTAFSVTARISIVRRSMTTRSGSRRCFAANYPGWAQAVAQEYWEPAMWLPAYWQVGSDHGWTLTNEQTTAFRAHPRLLRGITHQRDGAKSAIRRPLLCLFHSQ
jgi:hypothetical protein